MANGEETETTAEENENTRPAPGSTGRLGRNVNSVNLNAANVNLKAEAEALKSFADGLLDSNLIAGVLATRLTKQISFEFNKDGGLLKKLALGPAKAISEALTGFSGRIETQFESLIDSTQKFRQAVGGGITQVQALEQLQTGRQFLGTSFADLGITPENVLENIQSIRGQSLELSRLLKGDVEPNIAAFQSALAKLGVEDTGLDKFKSLVTDLNKTQGKELAERFKQLTALALGLQKATGRTLKASFATVFEEANKLTEGSTFNFNRLEKAIRRNAAAASQFGISVPGSLNKVLPSFQEVFGIARNLSIALKGFTIDPKSFLSQSGAERLESIFQSFRRARQAGTFQVEAAGLGRDQQVAFLSSALQGTGIPPEQINRLLSLLDQGETTLTGTDLEIPTSAQATAEIIRRAGDTRTREELRRTTAQRTAEQAAIADEEGRKQIGGVINLVIQDIDKITEKRGDALKQFGLGLRDTTTQFLKIGELAKQFGADEGPATFRGILAYSVFGPPGTFERTVEDISILGKTTEQLFTTLQSRKGTNVGDLVSEIKKSPVVKDLEENVKKLEAESMKKLDDLKKVLGEQAAEIERLKDALDKFRTLRGEKKPSNSDEDETNLMGLNPGQVREIGEIMGRAFARGATIT